MNRLIVTDLDGTLTSRDLILSPKVIEAVKIAKREGIRIRIATGNALPVSAAISKYTGMNDYVIAENGCIIGFNGVPVYEFGDREQSRKAFEYSTKVLKLKPKPWNIYRFIDFVLERGPDAKELEATLRSKGFRVRVVDSGYAIHILPEGVSKGKTIEWLIEREGIPREKVIALGDGKNDIELFEVASLSATPEDGDDELKKVADVVVRGNGEALYDLINRLLSGELP